MIIQNLEKNNDYIYGAITVENYWKEVIGSWSDIYPFTNPYNKAE